MEIKEFESLKTLIQLISYCFALTSNTLLIFLIVTKSPKKMGTYRSLMCYFCIISLIFTTLDVIVKPNIYSRESAFFMMMDLRNRMLPRYIEECLMSVLCGCCGMAIYGIAIHFVYRYFALERQGRLRFFKGAYQIFWFFIPIFGCLNWTFIAGYFFAMNPISTGYIAPMIEEMYNISINDAAYSAAVFWPPNEQGVVEFHWRSGLGLINLVTSMSLSLSVVIYTGVKSLKKIKQLLGRLESKFSKNLQMQLYKALVAQTLIPVLFIFIPFGILFTCPLFLIDCEFLSAPITVIYAVYPALDPLPCLFFVDNYRNFIAGLFSKNKKKIAKVSVVTDDCISKNIYSQR
ncbi:Serpentine receptor class r-10 [Caenorhabditis elegans]|uniref:Serpentine receptor class r-10 n=1 Tax=Caenorhabditis elegans TaxID=6239 RepID=O44533_CAEEL|nr:Seven TM Receptor [Caenorhabditis elegans]CCD73996.1 Seven TM Receptor [Caenorhabditis elegans]|eukprot:NP_500663.1 Seven TM Receptor [Caenorhabditis elegans]